MKLHYEIDGENFLGAGVASSGVKKILKQLSVSPETVRRVSVSMYEAEINTVIHGGGGYCDVEITPDSIYVKFVDFGKGIENIDLAMQEGYSTATTEIRELGFGAGMGLPNIKKYSDNLEIISEVGKGTTVNIMVKLD
jgi:serine/threonine-protein kinase RsbT